jgi:hypothetical protein
LLVSFCDFSVAGYAPVQAPKRVEVHALRLGCVFSCTYTTCLFDEPSELGLLDQDTPADVDSHQLAVPDI